ncbi:MAG: hypothetical protein ACXVHB_27620, partial [Solirubrobacteraceae bacterium]
AHSNALTTSPDLLSSINPTSLKADSVATEMAHYSIPRSGALLGAWRQISAARSSSVMSTSQMVGPSPLASTLTWVFGRQTAKSLLETRLHPGCN